MQENGIASVEEITPSQAQAFVTKIQNVKCPEITDYNAGVAEEIGRDEDLVADRLAQERFAAQVAAAETEEEAAAIMIGRFGRYAPFFVEL